MSAPTTHAAADQHQHRSPIAKWIRRLSIPIIVGWVVLIGVLNSPVPQLELVGQQRSVSMSPR